MENNKNSMANGLLIVVTIAAVLLVVFLIFDNSGVDVTDKKPISANQGVGHTTATGVAVDNESMSGGFTTGGPRLAKSIGAITVWCRGRCMD